MPVTELLGAALGPHYTVERELTGGGMSRVVVAHDRQLDRRVVVKILPPDLAATVSLERFRREILLAAGLQHPNIVPVLSAGEAGGLPYLVMPFVEGESLRLRVARGPLRVVETVGILRDVARALAYAHERGVVHRDIKPDNVLLTSGAAVVADFGVAKAIGAARRTGEVEAAPRGTITAVGTTLGTPDYMAPEQIAADPAADHRVDLYALGAMAYELLAGAPPFAGRSPQALLAAHLTEAPRPLAAHRADLPDALCQLVMRCLEKEPARRPASAVAVLEALEDPSVVSGAFATPLSLPTGTVPAMPPPARGARRWLLGAAAGLALATAATFGARTARSGGEAPDASPATAATASTATASTAPSVATAPSLAVLPLTYVGADTSFAYVAQGITSELTSAAGRVPGLRVLSQSATDQLRARLVRGESAQGAVTLFLEGVVQREGDELRVDARIVSTSDGFMLWADSWQGTVAERFELQRALGEAVVAALTEHLGAEPGGADRP